MERRTLLMQPENGLSRMSAPLKRQQKAAYTHATLTHHYTMEDLLKFEEKQEKRLAKQKEELEKHIQEERDKTEEKIRKIQEAYQGDIVRFEKKKAERLQKQKKKLDIECKDKERKLESIEENMQRHAKTLKTIIISQATENL